MKAALAAFSLRCSPVGSIGVQRGTGGREMAGISEREPCQIQGKGECPDCPIFALNVLCSNSERIIPY